MNTIRCTYNSELVTKEREFWFEEATAAANDINCNDSLNHPAIFPDDPSAEYF